MYYDDGETQWTGIAPGTAVTFAVTDGTLTSEVSVGHEKINMPLDEVVVLGVKSKPAEVNFSEQALRFMYNTTVSI